MSSLVKYLYPALFHKISEIFGKGKILHLITLFNSRKSAIHQTEPSFLGITKHGKPHSEAPQCSKTLS